MTDTRQVDINEFTESFWKVLKKMEPNFQTTQHNSDQIANLILYFYGSDKSKFSLNKGVALYGNTGSGKTLIMETFAKLCKYYKHNAFTTYYCDELAMDFKYNNGFERINKYCYYPALFDDLIGEKKQRMYGNFEDAFDYIFTKRERMKIKTHMTMNDRPDDFIKLFGPRMNSRKSTLFNFVLLKSDIDYRTLK